MASAAHMSVRQASPAGAACRASRRCLHVPFKCPQAVEASSPAPEDYDLRLPPVDGSKGAAREQKAVYVRPRCIGLHYSQGSKIPCGLVLSCALRR